MIVVLRQILYAKTLVLDLKLQKMNWKVTNVSANSTTKALEWETKKYINDIEMGTMVIMNLVHESRAHKVNEEKVWKTLLTHRWEIEILKGNSCLNEEQVRDVLYWIPKSDLDFGTRVLFALHYCPERLIESAKLFALFRSLITNENLNTVVAATMHNIKPRAGDNIKDFAAINMWYQRLSERYNFSLGPNILPLLTETNLFQLKNLKPPFLQYNKSFHVQKLIGKI